jgi:hypothetical protein
VNAEQRKADTRAKFPEIAAAVDFLRSKGYTIAAVAAVNVRGDEIGAVTDDMRADVRRLGETA